MTGEVCWNRFRRGSEVVEAEQWFCLDDMPSIISPLRESGVCASCGGPLEAHGVLEKRLFEDRKGEKVCPGDWIVRYASGEYHTVKPKVFSDLYEPVEGKSDEIL